MLESKPLPIFIIELRHFLDKWHLNEVSNAMYPKADIYGLISVGAAIATTPSAFDQFCEELSVFHPEFFGLVDINELEMFFKELQSSIMNSLLPAQHIVNLSTPPLFYKWVGPTTISLVGHREPVSYDTVQRAARQRAWDLLSQASRDAETYNGPFYRV